MATQAILVLQDGQVFEGIAIGAMGKAVGEVVFNTAMTGYQEIVTDPSYAQQIVTLTCPHIGNVGTNAEDNESSRCWAAGLVIRDYPLCESNWRSEESLGTWLCARNVVAIAEIDTRQLTQHIRDQGAMNGCIVAGDDLNVDQALAAAKEAPSLLGLNLAQVVSCEEYYERKPTEATKEHVVAYDFGIKENILRLLADRGCRLTVVPADTSADEVMALKPDGVFLSNGPGDPAVCYEAIAAVKTLLEQDIPLFGICLGHQLLALASGARTVKMKFGHHGANHPVVDVETGRVFITSQNHGFTVEEGSLPDTLLVTHRSLFDDSIQGMAHTDKSAFSFQGHPEGSPGPHDLHHLFDRFIASMGRS